MRVVSRMDSIGTETAFEAAARAPALREAIAADVSVRKEVPVQADQVVVTPGAEPVMYFAMLALIEPCDEVIVPEPCDEGIVPDPGLIDALARIRSVIEPLVAANG